jgi:hypothetical protein
MLPKKELNRLAREAHDRTFPAGTVLTDEQEVVRRLAWRLLFA